MTIVGAPQHEGSGKEELGRSPENRRQKYRKWAAKNSENRQQISRKWAAKIQKIFDKNWL